jgi:hypothetical protein
MDFKEEDLVFDYYVCKEQAKALLTVIRNRRTEWENPKLRAAVNNLLMDLEKELSSCLLNWMKDLAAMRKKKDRCIHDLLDRFARLAHDFELTPDKLDDKCKEILGDEWDLAAIEYFKYQYDTKSLKNYMSQILTINLILDMRKLRMSILCS